MAKRTATQRVQQTAAARAQRELDLELEAVHEGDRAKPFKTKADWERTMAPRPLVGHSPLPKRRERSAGSARILFQQWQSWVGADHIDNGRKLTRAMLLQWSRDLDAQLQCTFCGNITDLDAGHCPKCREYKGLAPYVPAWEQLPFRLRLTLDLRYDQGTASGDELRQALRREVQKLISAKALADGATVLEYRYAIKTLKEAAK